MTVVVDRPSRNGPPVRINAGPRLLAGADEGAGLAAHRARHPERGAATVADLAGLAEKVQLRGRGGAGFPFAVKLRAAAAGRHPVVVVNLSEGEPASYKDAALALVRPHLVLDGAALAARALGAHRVHLVLPGEDETVQERIHRAVGERDDRLTWTTHLATPRFVAGQARAVIELISGRPNLPVTAWQPEAVSGYRNRPTLLSNAETFAQLALAHELGADRFAALGTPSEPGTTLLTFNGESASPVVLEVPFGTPWSALVSEEVLDRPVLLGGFHGTWLAGGALRDSTVSRADAIALGASLGAGIVLPLAAGRCPVTETARITGYLADQSAGRCGPCVNGLPALAEAVEAVELGAPGLDRVRQLAGLLPGRGACAHPDGTVRLVASMLRTFDDEIVRHARGDCAHDSDRLGRTA